MKEAVYDVDYFIKKVESIPEENWTTGEYHNISGACCMHGHCGTGTTDSSASIESMALYKIFKKLNITDKDVKENVVSRDSLTAIIRMNDMSVLLGDPCDVVIFINDGYISKYQQTTPKERILAALKDVKKIIDAENQPVVKEVVVEKIVYKTVQVDSKIKALAKEEKILN